MLDSGRRSRSRGRLLRVLKYLLTCAVVLITVGGTAERAWGQQAPSTASAVPTDDPTPAPIPPGWIIPNGFVHEPGVLKRFVNATDGVVKEDGSATNGFYPQFGTMITGSGWIAAGPGFRHALGDVARIDMSAAISWNRYKVAQGRFELPHLADRIAVGLQGVYQDLTQVHYFGVGPDTHETGRSDYRLRNAEAIADATVRASSWMSIGGRFGWLQKPTLADGREAGVASTFDRYDDSSAPGLHSQPSFWYGDVSVAADSRDHAGHASTGGLYRATAAEYLDRDAGLYTFRRYELEATQFLPLVSRRWVIALRAREVFSQTTASQVVPFYMMPSLGGHNTLRGYGDYRFHDNDMQSFTAESRWSIFTHVDAAVFVDAGKVAPRPSDLDFHDLRRAYGVGLRVHNASTTLGRLDVGHSTEGWHVFFRISDALKRSTPINRQTTPVPFVP